MIEKNRRKEVHTRRVIYSIMFLKKEKSKNVFFPFLQFCPHICFQTRNYTPKDTMTLLTNIFITKKTFIRLFAIAIAFRLDIYQYMRLPKKLVRHRQSAFSPLQDCFTQDAQKKMKTFFLCEKIYMFMNVRITK